MMQMYLQRWGIAVAVLGRLELIKKAGFLGSITLVSRVLGMVRDVLIAFAFGATLVSDAFFIAFRPFDLARKMMADGILSISFVPVFSAYLAGGKKGQAVSMFLSACFLAFVLFVLVVCLGIYLAPVIIRILAPGYAAGSYAHTLSCLLLKIMLPYMGVILGVSLSMGVLNSLGRFYVPAATPILLNLVIICGAAFMADWFSPKVLILALGVTLGGLAQLALQLPFLKQAGMLDWRRFRILHPGVVRAAGTLIPSMIGAAAFQINMLVAGLAASKLVPGSVSFLYYAERLVQLPLALLAASVSTVFLPMLSQKAAVQDMDRIRGAFETGVRLVFFLTIPAMAGIMALNRPIVDLLFGRGAFDAASAAQTSDSLLFLVSGLWAMAGTRLLVTFHFALSNVRLPFFSGLVTIGCNLILSWFLAGWMGVTGLALSVALSSMAGFAFLAFWSPAGVGLGPLLVSACRALFLSGIMAVLVRWIWTFWQSAGGWLQGVGLMATIAAGMACFFAGAVLVADSEVRAIKEVMFGKK